MTEEDEDYDVVIDTLTKHRDKLWKMTKSNMNNDMMNIMDDIRLEQIDQLDAAMRMWKENKLKYDLIKITPRYEDHLWYPILVKFAGYHHIIEMQGKEVNEWNDMVNEV